MEEWVVELQEGVWIAPLDGDPGRTLHMASAKRFCSQRKAGSALKKARKYRPFAGAKVKRLFYDGRKNAESEAKDEIEVEQGRWQEAIYNLLGELAPGSGIDGGGCDSGDPLDLTLDEIRQGFSHWDNLLFDTQKGVGHTYGGSTFIAAAEKIKNLSAQLTAANARAERLREAAMGVVAHMEGRTPMRGWLRDNNASREALNNLVEALADDTKEVKGGK